MSGCTSGQVEIRLGAPLYYDDARERQLCKITLQYVMGHRCKAEPRFRDIFLAALLNCMEPVKCLTYKHSCRLVDSSFTGLHASDRYFPHTRIGMASWPNLVEEGGVS